MRLVLFLTFKDVQQNSFLMHPFLYFNNISTSSQLWGLSSSNVRSTTLFVLPLSACLRVHGRRDRALVSHLRPVCVHLEKTLTEACCNRAQTPSVSLSASPQCLPDRLVSVTGPLLVSSPLWWMATFPLFIASLNHTLMLSWPIFAALLYFLPLSFE